MNPNQQTTIDNIQWLCEQVKDTSSLARRILEIIQEANNE